MKRFMGILMAMLMIFSVTACNSDGKDAEDKKLSVNDDAFWGIGKRVGDLKDKYGEIKDIYWDEGLYLKFDDGRAYGVYSIDEESLVDGDECFRIETSFSDLLSEGERIYTKAELEELMGPCEQGYVEMNGYYTYTFFYKDYEIVAYSETDSLTEFKDEAVNIWKKQ